MLSFFWEKRPASHAIGVYWGAVYWGAVYWGAVYWGAVYWGAT